MGREPRHRGPGGEFAHAIGSCRRATGSLRQRKPATAAAEKAASQVHALARSRWTTDVVENEQRHPNRHKLERAGRARAAAKIFRPAGVSQRRIVTSGGILFT